MLSSQAAARGRAQFRKRIVRSWRLYVFLLIPIAYVIIFCYTPIFGLQLAFKDFNYKLGILKSPWAGLVHFRRFFQSYQFGRVLGNTLRISLYGLLAGFPLPMLLALLLNAVPSARYKKIVQTTTYMPHFISTVVMVGIIMQIFSVHTGLYGQLYQRIVGRTAPDLLGIADAFPHLYVWSGIWQNLGFDSVIYMAALSSVDPNLHEAAEIDGANRRKRLLYIDLPVLLPTASILLILSAGNIMNVGYEKVYLMQNSLNLRTSEVISTYVYKVGLIQGGGDFSFGTAIGMFNSVVNFVLILVVNFICARLGANSLW